MEALSCAYGGVNVHGKAAALHRNAKVDWVAAEMAAVPHPRQRQHGYYHNQLHPLPGAPHPPATTGDQFLMSDTLNCARQCGVKMKFKPYFVGSL